MPASSSNFAPATMSDMPRLIAHDFDTKILSRSRYEFDSFAMSLTHDDDEVRSGFGHQLGLQPASIHRFEIGHNRSFGNSARSARTPFIPSAMMRRPASSQSTPRADGHVGCLEGLGIVSQGRERFEQ